VPASAPPIPAYDDLSLASLRARLRGLGIDQVSQLVDYERSHANREVVVTMFERRIAKLGLAGPDTMKLKAPTTTRTPTTPDTPTPDTPTPDTRKPPRTPTTS
jgi:hypothetical protein